LIATFAQSFQEEIHIWTGLSRRLIPFEIPIDVVPWVNLGLLTVLVYFVYRLLTWPKVSDRITHFLRKKIIRRQIFQRVTVEELLISTGGYGVSRVAVQAGSPVIEKTLAESGLRSYDITVLAIVRDGQTVPNPPANMKILRGDELICFGKLGNIRSRILMNP
jgi:hypothetical protein